MQNTMFFSGKARPAEGLTSEKLYGILTIGLEVDLDSGRIISADCTLSTDVARNFFAKIITGYSFRDGLEPLLKILQKRYHGDVGKALSAALKSIYREYLIQVNNR